MAMIVLFCLLGFIVGGPPGTLIGFIIALIVLILSE